MRDQPVVGLAFGQHRAPFGGGNLCRDLRQGFLIHAVGQAILAELECAYEPAMDNQIRVAADRGREMGVATQVQPEVAVIFSGIFSLSLCTQDNFVDKLLRVTAFYASQNSINASGLSTPPLAKAISSVTRNSRNAWTFSIAGSSCTR